MELPTINQKQNLSRKRISKIRFAISTAIDEICEKENNEITYAEINAAILDVLRENTDIELEMLYNE